MATGLQISRTAEYMALFRALEELRRPRADRLFIDPFARHFLRRRLRFLLAASALTPLARALPWWIDRRWPGARASGVARTRLIDDWILQAVGAGASQLVILGAGFDCRALRIRGLEQVRIFELDRPALLVRKQRVLRSLLGQTPRNVRFTSIDFNRQELRTVLSAAGFDALASAVFIWEGVTNYLTAAAVDRTLTDIAQGSANGSLLIFTYVHRGALDGTLHFQGADRLLALLRSSGEPWTFGLDPAKLARYLAERGFHLIEDIGSQAYRARCMNPIGRHMLGYEFYRIAMARVSRASAADARRIG